MTSNRCQLLFAFIFHHYPEGVSNLSRPDLSFQVAGFRVYATTLSLSWMVNVDVYTRNLFVRWNSVYYNYSSVVIVAPNWHWSVSSIHTFKYVELSDCIYYDVK